MTGRFHGENLSPLGKALNPLEWWSSNFGTWESPEVFVIKHGFLGLPSRNSDWVGVGICISNSCFRVPLTTLRITALGFSVVSKLHLIFT